MERSPELEAITRRMATAMSRTDVEAMRGVGYHGPGSSSIGTDPEEFWRGEEILALREAQSAFSETTIDLHEVEAWEHEGFGWSIALGHFVLEDRRVPIRGSIVFVLMSGQWRSVHTHTSIGIANEESIGHTLPTSLDTVAHAVEVERPDLSPVTAPDGTVTLLFTDIEGSTERNQDLGDREWMGILRHHHDLIREQVAANQGFEVKSMGDGFMIAFSSARRALRCALDIQHAIAKEDELDVRVRAGLHAGEAVRDGDDFYGATVNMAARVAGAAQGGEILVSSIVKALVESSGEFSFDPPRTAELKGILGTQELHPVVT